MVYPAVVNLYIYIPNRCLIHLGLTRTKLRKWTALHMSPSLQDLGRYNIKISVFWQISEIIKICQNHQRFFHVFRSTGPIAVARRRSVGRSVRQHL